MWVSHQKSAPHIAEQHVETVTIDGRIYTIGDTEHSPAIAYSIFYELALPVHVFDPVTMKWYPIQNRTSRNEYIRAGYPIIQFRSNRYSLAAHQHMIYLFGDGYKDRQRTMILLCYNTKTNKWTAPTVTGMENLPFVILESHGAFVFDHGMYIYGGWNVFREKRTHFNTDLFRLDLISMTLVAVVTTNSLPVRMFASNQTVLRGHRFYVFNGSWPDSHMVYLDLHTCQWHEVRYNWRIGKPMFVQSPALCMHDDRLLMFGNYIGEDRYYNGVHCFDLRTRCWSRLTPCGVSPNRYQDIRTAVVLGDRWYLFGGKT